jgi:hypothetical protein
MKAQEMKDEAFAWPWDLDAHHAVPHHVGGFMASHSRVNHADLVDSSSSDFSTVDGDSSSSGGDFMDNYIRETGAKPMQMDGDKPKEQKQEPSIPDMASLFSDDTKAQSKAQQPWNEQHLPAASSDMANFFAGSFDGAAKASFNFDPLAKLAPNVDSDSHTDDMTNLFGGRSSDSAAPVEAAGSTSDSTFAWPSDTHTKKNEGEEHSRDLWASNSDSNTLSSSSSDLTNMFRTSNSGSSDSSNSYSTFSDWSSNDFGGKVAISEPAHAPQQQDAAQRSADSPIQGPTQRVSSISGASVTNQVVDIRLSSELQQSLLQARSAETKTFQRFRGVLN